MQAEHHHQAQGGREADDACAMHRDARQDTPPERIPKVPTPDGKGKVVVIAGEALGTKAVIETRSPMYVRAHDGL